MKISQPGSKALTDEAKSVNHLLRYLRRKKNFYSQAMEAIQPQENVTIYFACNQPTLIFYNILVTNFICFAVHKFDMVYVECLIDFRLLKYLRDAN